MLFFGHSTVPTQRSYKTNLAFEATLVSLTKKYSIPYAIKGHATFYLPKFPKVAVQITTRGFVQILRGKIEIDEQILKILAPEVVTKDSQPFNWNLNKQTKGEKELREDYDVEAQRRLLRLFLGQLEYQLIPLGTDSSYDELNRARELLATLPSKLNSLDHESISECLSEIRDLMSEIDQLKENLDPSTWYTGR